MKSCDLRRCALSSCVAMAMLAGCGGSQPSIGAPQAAGYQQTLKLSVHSRSSGDALLCVSNDTQSSVNIYSYPSLKQVGTLASGRGVAGLCSDTAGNVWVVAGTNSDVTLAEYAHGGNQPIATLSLPGGEPDDCTVDAAGSLAVVHNADYVSVYENEQGTPQTYKDEGIGEIYSLTYDTQGDLFIYGTKSVGVPRYPIVGELAYGEGSFSNMRFHQKVPEPDMTFAQWNATDLLLAGVTKRTKSTYTETVWKVAVSQSQLKITGENTFEAPNTRGARGIGRRALVEGKKLIQQDNSGNTIWLFSYPAGGSPTDMLKTGRGSGRTGLALSE
jgi:hypothetical protein